MAERNYRMSKRAEAVDATRERIVEATLELHLQNGVVATSHSDIAERAGVGAATVYRHFPTLGALVEACGARVDEIIQLPEPADAPGYFAGLTTSRERLERLVQELDRLYERAAQPLTVALKDRDRVPELDLAMQRFEASVEALVRAAAGDDAPEDRIRLVIALTAPPAWQSVKRHDIPSAAMVRLLGCALAES